MDAEKSLRSLIGSMGIKPNGKDFGLVLHGLNSQLNVDDTWMSNIGNPYANVRNVGSMVAAGSHAFGLNDGNSDIDILAIVYPAAIDYQRNTQALEQVTTKTCDISFHDVRVFVSNVITKGPSMNHLSAIYANNRIDDALMSEVYRNLSAVVEQYRNVIVKNLFWTAHSLYQSALSDNNRRSRSDVLKRDLMPVRSACKVHSRIYHLCEWACQICDGGDINPNSLSTYVFETYQWARKMDDPRRSFGLARKAMVKLSSKIGVVLNDGKKVDLPEPFQDLCDSERNIVFESSYAKELAECLITVNTHQLAINGCDAFE